MHKTKFQERATAAKGSIVALASVDGNDPTHILRCSTCGSDQVVSASFDDPHCANCGSDELYENSGAEMQIADEVETVGYECAKCHSGVHISTAAVAALGNKVCCSNCGTAIALDLSIVDDSDVEDQTAAEETDAEGLIEADEDLDGIEADLTGGEQFADVDQQIEELHVEGSDEELNFPGEVESEKADAQSDEMPGNNYGLTEEGEALLDSVECDDKLDDVQLCSLAGRLCVAKGSIIVASISEDEAGDNADLLGTDTFEQAFMTTGANHGLRKAIAAYGFRMVRSKSITQASVNAQVNKVKQQLTASAQLTKSTMTECAALASACLSRGIIKKDLAIANAISSELSALGVKNSAVVAKRILANTGHEFAKAIMVEADRLAKATVEYRKDLQQALSDENLDFNPEVEAAEGEDGQDTIQARLSVPATVPALLRPQAVTAATSIRAGGLFSNL